MTDGDFTLPSLDPSIRISRAPDGDGEPYWTLHHPPSDRYFKIDWAAFECLSRFSRHKSADALKAEIEENTTLSITRDQIADIVRFLHGNALVALKDQEISQAAPRRAPLWKKAMHGYLYFTVPLFRPQEFLRKTYPAISFLFSRFFVLGMLAFLGMMVLATLPRLDEFLHTFTQMVSLEGAAAVLIVFGLIKIVHEWAHAYTATRYGVDVPHMGVALIVLYPVLYTETTGSWRLSSRRARIHIALAGILAELCLAGIFLAVWHIAPPGSLWQSAAFLVTVVSLAGSLLINLNPLMRFDGYYLFSDLTGIDNLQSRSCAMARWKLRELLFALGDPVPEDAPPARKKLLLVFGTSLLIYRFFLFLGIALLVYHMFFQPLGLLLFLVEIVWFILLPIWSELIIWWKRRRDILARPRTLAPAFVLLALFLMVVTPWKGSVTLPAMLHAAQQEIIYPPGPSQILRLAVEEGQVVKAGDILATLSSADLERDLKKARQTLSALETMRARAQTNPVLLQDPALSEETIEKARVEVRAVETNVARLTVRAPFDGIVRDLGADIEEGRYVAPYQALLTVVGQDDWVVSGYADEGDQPRIESGATAFFYPGNSLFERRTASVTVVALTGEARMIWPELSSQFGGPVPSDPDRDGGAAVARRALYEIRAGLQDMDGRDNPQVLRGYLRIATVRKSILSIWINDLISVFQREVKIG